MPLPDLWNFEKADGPKIHLSGYRYIDSSYKDTIFKEDRYLLKKKNYTIDSIIKNKDGDHRYDQWICTISNLYAQEMIWKVVAIDSIKSFTFAHLNKKFKYLRLRYLGLRNVNLMQFGGGYTNGGNCALAALLFYYLIDLVIFLTINLICNGVDHLNGKVRTYHLNEWKIRVKYPSC